MNSYPMLTDFSVTTGHLRGVGGYGKRKGRGEMKERGVVYGLHMMF